MVEIDESTKPPLVVEGCRHAKCAENKKRQTLRCEACDREVKKCSCRHGKCQFGPPVDQLDRVHCRRCLCYGADVELKLHRWCR